MRPNEFEPGNAYTWDQLGEAFGFSPDYLRVGGGMLPRPKLNAMLLMTHREGARSIDYGDE